MFLKYIPTIFTWWLYILLLTLIFLPVANKYLKAFPGRGYAFGKTMGISFSALGSFLLAYLHLSPVGKVGILAVPALFLIWDLWLFFQWRAKKSTDFSYKIFKTALFEGIGLELLFLFGLFFWAYVRSQQPDLLGLEKYMDYGFVKSILRSTYMPAADMWLAGASINYYYFGQYICAVMSILTNTAADVSYNMMLAVIFSEAMILSFSLGAGIYRLFFRIEENALSENGDPTAWGSPKSYRRALLAGVLSMALLVFGGNLHSFFYGYAFPLAEKIGWKAPAAQQYYYPDSTRFIGYNPDTDDKTITEFPSYSAVVSDLHGHVSDIPQALLFCGFAVALAGKSFRGSSKGTDSYSLGLSILTGALLGGMFMTNAWDYPIYFTVLFLLILFSTLRFSLSSASIREKRINLFNSVLTIGMILMVSVATVLPFSNQFQNFSQGIAFVHSHSPFWQLFLLYGHFWLLTLPFACYTFWRILRFLFHLRKKNQKYEATSPFAHFPMGRLFLLILIFCGYGLILIPEIVYVRDIYEQGYHRANTMFKVTYQAFILLSLCCGPAFTDLWVHARARFNDAHRKQVLSITAAVVLFLFAACSPLLFLFKAIPCYYGSLSPSHSVGLQGTSFLKAKYGYDQELVDWLNKNVSGQPTILEAPGASYSESARISAMTGLPTVVGWHVHEWLWRNSNDIPTEREKEVDLIYGGAIPDERIKLLTKYQVRYIILSDLEKKKYPGLLENGILDYGDIVYQAGSEMILKVRLP